MSAKLLLSIIIIVALPKEIKQTRLISPWNFFCSYLLYVQEVVTAILYSNLLYKMGLYFLDKRYD